MLFAVNDRVPHGGFHACAREPKIARVISSLAETRRVRVSERQNVKILNQLMVGSSS